MFSQNNTGSPYRSSVPQQSSPFNQQSSSSYFGSSTSQQPSNTFAGPQFGGGNSQGQQWGAGSPYASQFGQGAGQGGQGGAGGYGGQFGQGGQGAAGGQGTPGFGEKAKRNYLPGYLSGGVAAQAESTPPQAMNDERSWESPAGRRTSVSGSPVTRFGGGSLFGGRDATPSKSPKYTPYTAPPRATAYRAEPEEDAPPVASLNEYEANEPTGLQVDSNMNSLRRSPSNDPTASPFSSTSAPLHSAPPSSSGYAVNVFGFPPSALDLILDYFSQFGEVVSRTPSEEGGNWVTISYAQPWSAARAARKNGEILSGVLMVGVKAVDEDGLKRALAGSEGDAIHSNGSSTPAPRPLPAVSTPSGVGKPVNVLGPQSAFKAAPTPTRKSYFGLGGTPSSSAVVTSNGGGGGGGGDPHASLFADKSRQAVLQQQGQQQKGVLGKVSDMVFGW